MLVMKASLAKRGGIEAVKGHRIAVDHGPDRVFKHLLSEADIDVERDRVELVPPPSNKAGISFGKDDLVIPKAKELLVSETEDMVKEYEKQYQEGGLPIWNIEILETWPITQTGCWATLEETGLTGGDEALVADQSSDPDDQNRWAIGAPCQKTGVSER